MDLALLVNGKRRECRAGATLLDVLQEAGIELPALCHDPRVKPCGSCRLCLVEIEGWRHPMAACTTPAVEGMAVRTHTPELEAGRKATLAMQAERYPEPAVRQWH